MYQVHHLDRNKPVHEQFEGIPNGPSPGYAASILGITRQNLHKAIQKGAIRAHKIYDNGHHVATYVDPYSLDKYKELRELNGGRIPYRAKAI